MALQKPRYLASLENVHHIMDLIGRAWELYGVNYGLFPRSFSKQSLFELTTVISREPGKGNATKALSELILFARRRKLNIIFTCSSMRRDWHNDPLTIENWPIQKRALQMYLRAGFKINPECRIPNDVWNIPMYFDPGE